MSITLESETQPLDSLCQRLAAAATELDLSRKWPSQQMSWLAEAGVFRWFIPEKYGGWGWSEDQILNGYLALSQSCLTTAFVLTQWNAACRRILGSTNTALQDALLPKLAQGDIFATVGISHLTTSRQHVGKPVLSAESAGDGEFILNGFSPWVTGGEAADVIVLGATLDDNRQLLAAVPTSRAGVEANPSARLIALTASCTGQVDLRDVPIRESDIVAGPVENVLQTNSGGGSGGLQTSTLAVGLSLSAVEFLRAQAVKREELRPVAEKMAADCDRLQTALRELTAGNEVMTAGDLRQQANSMVLRSTQAALQAAKGAGFIETHPTGRWAREAMFFLVWSCPQPVAQAGMCELAQLS